MAREIVKNLKFKKYSGKFDVNEFADKLNAAYLATKRPDGHMQKKSFSPSSFGYGHGNCPRYWYMAFNGANFIDDNDAQAVANMAHGTQAHDRIQGLMKAIPDYFKSIEMEVEIKNEYPPIRGFADSIIEFEDYKVIAEIKTAKQEVWDTRQSEMAPTSNHMLQLLSYMHIKQIDEGFFLYENKNTQEVLVIPVMMTDKNKQIIEGLFLWLREVWDNYKDGGLPMRPFTKTQSACKYCPLKKACWAKDASTGEVQIEAYEVPSL